MESREFKKGEWIERRRIRSLMHNTCKRLSPARTWDYKADISWTVTLGKILLVASPRTESCPTRLDKLLPYALRWLSGKRWKVQSSLTDIDIAYTFYIEVEVANESSTLLNCKLYCSQSSRCGNRAEEVEPFRSKILNMCCQSLDNDTPVRLWMLSNLQGRPRHVTSGRLAA